MSTIIGWLGMVVFLIAAVLIACHYRHVWHDLFHMSEPFTHYFSLMAVSSPFAWWGSVAFLMVLAVLTAWFGEAWQRIMGIAWTGFFVWFIPHIIQHIQNEAETMYHELLLKFGDQKACRNMRYFRA